MEVDQLNFFKKNGYLVLEDVLTAEEIEYYRELFDRDRSETGYMWRSKASTHQSVNCDVLISSPEFDGLIRHPRLLPHVEEILGGPVGLAESCLRHMGPYEGKPGQGWHRDRKHDEDHPLRTAYVHVLIYLADVDGGTHCFSISPEACDDPILETEEQLARRGKVDLHGPAGTAVLFNLSVLHAAHIRPTTKQRKTIQTYYGLQAGPILSQYTVIPTSLWRDHPKPDVRMFYSLLNDKSKRFNAAYGNR